MHLLKLGLFAAAVTVTVPAQAPPQYSDRGDLAHTSQTKIKPGLINELCSLWAQVVALQLPRFLHSTENERYRTWQSKMCLRNLTVGQPLKGGWLGNLQGRSGISNNFRHFAFRYRICSLLRQIGDWP